MKTSSNEYTVGALAKRTGVTVRALHHYDALGLVVPSSRTPKGYRLYNMKDVERLTAVRALQDAGFPLASIAALFRSPKFGVADALRKRIEQLREKAELELELSAKLARVAALLTKHRSVSLEEFIHILIMMNHIKSMGLSKEDEAKLEAHWSKLTPEDIKKVEAEWPTLIAAMREKMEAAADPKSPEVQKLAKRWKELVHAFSAGIPAVHDSVRKNWQEHGEEIRAQHGGAAPDPALFAYVHKALE